MRNLLIVNLLSLMFVPLCFLYVIIVCFILKQVTLPMH